MHRIRVNGPNCGRMDTRGEDALQRRCHRAGDGRPEAAEARPPKGVPLTPDHMAGLATSMLSEVSGVMTGALVDFDQTVAGAYPE